MHETLAECLLKSNDAQFIDYTAIDISEVTIDNKQDLLEKGGKKAILQSEQPDILDCIAKDFEITISQMQQKLV